MRILFILLLIAAPAWGQIVEQSDPLRPSSPDSTRRKARPIVVDSSAANLPADTTPARLNPVFRYKLTADGTFSRGNVTRDLLQLATALDYQLSNYFKLSSNPSFVYGRQSGILAEREWFGDFRTTLRHEKRLYYLAFGSFERSNLRQINRRWTYAAGLGYKLLSQERAYISVTNVLLREYTDFIEGQDIDVVRNSARLFGEYKLGKNNRYVVTHTAFYQPAIGTRNIRWNASLSLQLKLTTHTSLRTTLANAYESVVAPGRQNNDLRVTIGLAYERK